MFSDSHSTVPISNQSCSKSAEMEYRVQIIYLVINQLYLLQQFTPAVLITHSITSRPSALADVSHITACMTNLTF